MNYRVDIIIIGDSKSGHSLLDNIMKNKPYIHTAFVSKTFKSTTMHDYVNVKYFKNQVEYISFRSRLFCICLDNGDRLFSTHIVIASGVAYEPLILNNEKVPCVFNTLDDIPKSAKSSPALVIGDEGSDIKFALEVAKRYKQVYFCTKELDISKKLSAATANKLNQAENIVILPNTTLKKANTKNGILQTVELDNYSTINCSAIFIKTKTTPEIDFIPRKIIKRDELGYLEVSDRAESTLVPKCFAIGNCISRYTKTTEKLVIDAILQDF